MKSLPIEIVRKILHFVIWLPDEAPTLDVERWEDGIELLFPREHPLHAVAGNRSSTYMSELEETLRAVKRSSRALRRLVQEQFRSYFQEIQVLPIVLHDCCQCRPPDQAPVGVPPYLFEDMNGDGVDDDWKCRLCRHSPVERWVIYPPACIKRQAKLGVERACECSSAEAARTLEDGEACRACGGAGRPRWTLRKPVNLVEAGVKALYLTHGKVRRGISRTQLLRRSTYHLRRYTNLAAVEIRASCAAWVYAAVTALARSSPGLRQVHIFQMRPLNSGDNSRVCSGALSALIDTKHANLEVLHMEDDIGGSLDESVDQTAKLVSLLVSCQSTLRHLRLRDFRLQPVLSTRNLGALDDPSFKLGITRLSIESVEGDDSVCKLVESCSTTLEYLKLCDAEIGHLGRNRQPVTFPALRHLEARRVDWWDDGMGRGSLPCNWACPALQVVERKEIGVYY